MINKKVIAFDLDGTLALSKSLLTPPMAEVLCRLLSKYFVSVISGGAFPQFQKQFLSQLHCSPEQLKNLYLFPTMGSKCCVYDMGSNDWKVLYEENLSEDERNEIIQAFNYVISELELDLSNAYGDVIEDRNSQITFSGCGQNAPLEVKEVWDPDQSKRGQMVDLLKAKIPQFEVRIGGMTSIDVVRPGINKAYAIGKIRSLLNVTDDDILFVGDALYRGGNDSSVKTTGVDFIQETGPDEVIRLLSAL